jgi:hypothetical protein
MKRFEVYSGTTLVGWSDLEGVDRAMATAYGALAVADGYARIRSAVIALRGVSQGELDLSVRLTGSGRLQCDFIHIADHSDDAAVDGVEVSAHGISAPRVDDLFPRA